MEETIFAVIWVVIKSFISSIFSKKDPEVAQVKAAIQNAKLLRKEDEEMQKPSTDYNADVDELRK